MTKKRVAVIDADTFGWVVAYHNKENDDSFTMLHELDRWIQEVFFKTKADLYCGFIQGRNNFRSQMFPDYKGNRPAKPEWYTKWAPTIINHLLTSWKFEQVDGMETDDAVASASFLLRGEFEPIVCSGDKDLRQVPGAIYNTNKKELSYITPEEAKKTLMLQILTGDMTDNVRPVKRGIGPVKAQKLLEGDMGNRIEITTLKAFLDLNDESEVDGLTKFAENVLKIALRRDKNFKFTLNEVPNEIKQLYGIGEGGGGSDLL